MKWLQLKSLRMLYALFKTALNKCCLFHPNMVNLSDNQHGNEKLLSRTHTLSEHLYV